jgi:hypothetical protein
MTATMILKEIATLPPREKVKLFKELEREREEVEMQDDVRLFDEAKKETAGEKPMPLRQFLKQAKIKV